jgi:hypothetical protein
MFQDEDNLENLLVSFFLIAIVYFVLMIYIIVVLNQRQIVCAITVKIFSFYKTVVIIQRFGYCPFKPGSSDIYVYITRSRLEWTTNREGYELERLDKIIEPYIVTRCVI